MNRAIWLLSVGLFVTLATLSAALADDPAGLALDERIDALIDARAGRPVAPPADDAEFFRRAWLDFGGKIPQAAEVRVFLADADPAKRERLIDSLLASPHFARRMQHWTSTLLLERRTEASIPEAQWQAWLRDSWAANKPWNVLVSELLFSAEGAAQPAAKFLLVDGRQDDPHRTTQDLARIFLGRDVLCSQCHDHPTIHAFTQTDYQGLFAFVQDKQPGVEYESVFEPGKKSTAPRLPGSPLIPAASLAPEADAAVAKAQAEGRRKELASRLPATDDPLFMRNSVNRFWRLLLGRGLVEPLEELHEANPASHPELHDLLATEFAVRSFDVRHLLREIALSKAYQRASRLSEEMNNDDVPPESYRIALLKPLSPEQMAWSVLEATGQLPELEAAPTAEASSFTFADYANGRIAAPPANLPDAMKLFVAVFGGAVGEAEEKVFPATGQALFLMNERLILSGLQAGQGGRQLVGRLTVMSDVSALADELYLSILSRLPTDEERTEVQNYLEHNPARREAALGELAWALLASAEFRFCH